MKRHKITIYASTDIGFVRQNNEDSYFCLPEQQTWAVLDGMGGHESGETASAIAVYSYKITAVAGLFSWLLIGLIQVGLIYITYSA